METRFEYNYRKWEYFAGFFGLLVVTGAYFLFLGPEQRYLLISMGLIVWTLVLGFVWVTIVFNKNPAYVISKEGLYDNRMGFGLIEWADIKTAVTETGPRYTCFLKLGVNDAEKYLQWCGRLERIRQRAFGMGHSLIYLNLNEIRYARFGKRRMAVVARDFINRYGSPPPASGD